MVGSWPLLLDSWELKLHLQQILMGVNELLKSPPLNGPFPYYSNVVASISNASILGLVKNILQNI